MSTPTSILTIGLDFDWTAANRGEKFDINAIRTAVAKGLETLNNVDGLYAETFFLNPDKKGVFDEVTSKLQAGHSGNPWSGVIIGWGVRGVEDTTPVFETLVNLIKDTTPGSKLIFTGPAPDHFGAIQRNFPHLKRGS
ncbi:hypothetical protein GTA08_BOTSDO05968 [Neofusicoccum parvum]|uniref:Uncharacterized protein n=1 Tax=Neofusicoccum parvum TaxID=310453 RepID=A0ACB5S5D5_9PEZI|nr:hypothetical protein GTA08_BOTSDO05968 [Neofusicoccum parvum]